MSLAIMLTLVLFSFNLIHITSLGKCWDGLGPLCMGILKFLGDKNVKRPEFRLGYN